MLKVIHIRGGIITKANRFVVIGVILSVVMSAAALAWQTKETAPFAKYFRPLNTSDITEAEFRSLKAELEMLRVRATPVNGIYPGGLDFSEDRKVATIHVPVDTASLPANYDERKKVLNENADICIGSVLMAFDFAGTGLDPYVVKFVDEHVLLKATANASKGKERTPPDAGLVALYKNGQLTMR